MDHENRTPPTSSTATSSKVKEAPLPPAVIMPDSSESVAPDLNATLKAQKDIWDKIGALAPIISGLLIFVMGGYFTYSYNQQQLRVQEIQTIEKFIPHLMGNEQSKKAAILAISLLTNAELAGKFAQIFASKGTVDALQSMAENGSESDKSAASTALAKALENIAARESKLNEMETAFQQALNEKNGQQTATTATDDQIAEADRLEHLADMSRTRGQLSVAEALLKQAINIRIRVQLPVDAKEVIASLKKLSEVEQATGNKEEADGTLKKIALIEAKLGSQVVTSAPVPPPAPPGKAESAQISKNGLKTEVETFSKEKESHESAAEGENKSEIKIEKESSASEHERPSGENSSGATQTRAPGADGEAH